MNKKPLILGHRGYRAKYPENTALAFEKAYEYGADGIECDIQKCSDGTFFVFHDQDLERITGRRGLVSELDRHDIDKLDAGMGETIPDLDSFLDSLPADKLINIELKEETLVPSDCPLIIRKLEARGLKNNILISSFRHDLLPDFKSRGFLTGMLFSMETLKPGIFSVVRNVGRIGPHYLNLPAELFTRLPVLFRKVLVFLIKKSGRSICLWTVNDPALLPVLSEFADVIITDRIEDIIQARDRL